MLITSLIGQNQAQRLAEQQQDDQDVLSNSLLYDYVLNDPNAPLPLKAAAHKGGMELAEEHGGKDIQDQLPVFGQMLGTLAMGSTIKGLQNRQLLAQAMQAQQGDKPSPFAPADTTTAALGAPGSPRVFDTSVTDPSGLGWTTNQNLAGTAPTPLPPAPDVSLSAPAPPLPVTPTQEGPPTRRRMLPGGQTEEVPYIPPAAAVPSTQPPGLYAAVQGAGTTPAQLNQGIPSPWTPSASSVNLTNVGGYLVPAGTGVPGTTPLATLAGTPGTPGTPGAAPPHLSRWQRFARGLGRFGAGMQGQSLWAEQDRTQMQQQAKIAEMTAAADTQRKIDDAQRQRDLQWFDQNEAQLQAAGFTPKEIQEMRIKVMLPKGVNLAGMGGTSNVPGVVSGYDGELQEAAAADPRFDPSKNYHVTRDKVTGKIIRWNQVGTNLAAEPGAIYNSLKMIYPNKPDAEVRALAGEEYFRRSGIRLNNAVLNTAINSYLSGTPVPQQGIPGGGTATQQPVTTPGGTGGTATTQQPPPPPDTGTTTEPPPPPPAGGLKDLTPQERPLVDLAMRNISLTGSASGGGRGAAAAGGLRGYEIIVNRLKALGLPSDPVSVAEDVKLIQSNMKSLDDLQQKANSFMAVNERIKYFAANFEDLARRVNNVSGRWLNTPWRDIKLGVVGDPVVDQYLMSLNAMDRMYTTLTSSPQSNAMLPEGAREHVQSLLPPGMTLQEALGIPKQLHAEAQADVKGFNDALQNIRRQVNTSPIGQALGAPQGGGGGAAAGGGGGGGATAPGGNKNDPMNLFGK